MKKQETSIHDLEKEVQSILLEIEEIKKNVGTIVLPSKDKKISKADCKVFDKLEEEQKQIMASITEIENIQELISQQKKLQKSIQDTISTLSSQWDEGYSVFGKTLISNYTPQMASVIGATYTEVQVMISKIEDLESQFEQQKTDLEEQGFFTKMISQVKLSTLGTTVSAQKRRLENLYVSAGKTVFESSFLQTEEGKGLDIVITQAWDVLNALKDEIESKKSLLAAAIQEEKDLTSKLDAIGVSGSFNKKLEAFSSRLMQKQDELIELYKKTGGDFISVYVKTEGKKGAKIPEDMPASLIQMVKEAQKQFSSLFVYRQKIEIVKLATLIADKEKSILTMQQSILDNDVRISRLQTQNKEFAEKITQHANEKDDLLLKKIDLEKTIN